MLVVTEAKLAWRQPLGPIFGLGLPLLGLIILGVIPSANHPSAALHGGTLFNAEVPILMLFVLVALALWSLPIPLATYRGQGVLRRMSTTPVPRSWLLGAQVVVNLILAVVAEAIILGVGAGAFGLVLPSQVGGYLLSLVLAAAALFGLGLLATAVARTPQVANAIALPLFFPLMFFAGLWIPQAKMPAVLRHISTATPTGATVKALQASLAGHFPAAQPLLVLVAWAVAFILAAIWLFRWE